MKKDLYATVTNQILAQLETGSAPWVKPWRATAGRNVAANADTNRPYSGVNIVMLWSAMACNADWIVPRFVTFRQAQKLGGSVRAGQHGTKVYFVKKMIGKPKAGEGEGEETKGRAFSFLREYTVFNVAQCDGLPARCHAVEDVKPRNADQRDGTIDDFVALTSCEIRSGGDRAFYVPSMDFVQMPNFQDFKSADHFYATEFHEMAHWTGSEKRLAREFGKRFGDNAYAAEELVAELCAAFLCAEFGLDGDLRHAAYIKNWIALLKSDSKAFFTAASKAQQAADYLRAFALQDASSGDDDGEADEMREAA